MFCEYLDGENFSLSFDFVDVFLALLIKVVTFEEFSRVGLPHEPRQAFAKCCA